MTYEDFITGLCCEFELAFLSAGLQPVRRAFGDGNNNGCMVTALDVCEHGNVGVSPPKNGFWESLKYEFELMTRDAKRVQRVKKFRAAEHVEFDQGWWGVFVSYCMMSFDGNATYPCQWMTRNRYAPVRTSESPKLFGAAVGGLVQRHVFSAANRENCNRKDTRTYRGYQPVQVHEGLESAFWPSCPSEHTEAIQSGTMSGS